LDNEKFRQLEETDWEAVGVELAGHAAFRARNLTWRTGDRLELARGFNPVDVAQEAILKVLDGSRDWDPKRGPLIPYLKGVVDSLISHLADSADNQIQVRLPEGEDGEEVSDRLEFEAPRNDNHGWLTKPPPRPDGGVSGDADGRVDKLFAAVSDKKELMDVVEAVMELDDPKPAAIAEQLGVPVKDINNRLKRLRRVGMTLKGEGEQPAKAANTDGR